MDVSTYLRNKLRTHVFRTGSFTKPAALYFSLHCGSPGLVGSNEVSTSGTAYARVQRDPLDANWTAEATDGLTKNAADIAYAAPTANWNRTGAGAAEQVTYVGIWDAITSGNFLGGFALTAGKTINSGDAAPAFPAGDLSYQFRDPTE